MKNLLYPAFLLLAGSSCHAQPTIDYSAPAYRATLHRFDQRRTALAARYRHAATPAGRAACLAEALDNEIEWGVWGGLTERERRALLRKRPNVTSWRQLLETAKAEHEQETATATA